MNKTKLFTTIARNNGRKLLMSTQTASVETFDDKKLEYYRSLDAADTGKGKPAEWDEAKPFESIPGPKPLPVVGNAWRFFLPKIGTYYGADFLDVHKQMNQEFGDIAILKELIGMPTMVMLFNPKDIEKLHRNEGVWPDRAGVESIIHYRNMRTDILNTGGLVALYGEDWFKFRSTVNPILMQAKNIEQYTDKMSTVADELIDNMKHFAKQNKDGQMPDDFQQELYKWALESVGVVTLDAHLGCLKRDAINPETKQLIDDVLKMFDLMFKLDFRPSLWKYVSTPTWREFVGTMDSIIGTNLKYINRYLDKIEKGEVGPNQNEATSALHQLLKIDRTIAVAMSVDMLGAGVDTTGRILAAALYFLARNTDKQNILRDEAYKLLNHKDDPVTKENLSKALYTKAAVKETTRMAPIGIGNTRITKKDMVLGGYQIPARTNVLTSLLMLSREDKHYAQARDFIPERWLKTTTGELSHKNTNPFLFAPFGFGPRSCVGKRLANLELETAVLKIVRNFELKWPHEDMVFATKALHGIAGPLKIQVKALDS